MWAFCTDSLPSGNAHDHRSVSGGPVVPRH